MKKAVSLILFFAVISCFIPLSAKENIKIAVIDMNRVFEKYNKTRINEGKLKKQAEIFRNYANELVQSRNKLQKEFIKLRDDSQNMAFTEAERENRRLNAQEKYQQVAAKEREIQQYNREKQIQLRDEYDKLRNAILQDISNVVTSKCIAEGYTIALDKSGRTLNNIPLVVYSTNSIDITESVIKILNMGQAKQSDAK